MFFKMSQKHTKRILGYEDYRPFWHFFDWKAYLIMTCMMSGGIGFRAAGIFSRYIYRIFLFRSGLSFGTGRSYFYKKLYVLQSIN